MHCLALDSQFSMVKHQHFCCFLIKFAEDELELPGEEEIDDVQNDVEQFEPANLSSSAVLGYDKLGPHEREREQSKPDELADAKLSA